MADFNSVFANLSSEFAKCLTPEDLAKLFHVNKVAKSKIVELNNDCSHCFGRRQRDQPPLKALTRFSRNALYCRNNKCPEGGGWVCGGCVLECRSCGGRFCFMNSTTICEARGVSGVLCGWASCVVNCQASVCSVCNDDLCRDHVFRQDNKDYCEGCLPQKPTCLSCNRVAEKVKDGHCKKCIKYEGPWWMDLEN